MPDTAVGVGVDIRLLGPVEAWKGSSAVQLGGPRQRGLLALLALQANEPVSVERLVSALFGVDAPESSVNAVQVAVSRLRRQLDHGMVETSPGGYLLRLSPDQLDLARFERLLGEGRALLRSGNAAAAGATLRSALELFRGAPLADVPSLDFALLEIRRLEELRLAAVMDRLEADLALGRGGDLVPELEALVAEHPLDERLRGQLMLALYRAGRQSDALSVYRETRELLRDELGLEPSRALQGLELAILRHDRELEHPEPLRSPAPVADGVVICPFKGLAPFGVGDAAYFFGRERLVDELVARLAGASFVGLVGPSGSGKSSLLQAGLLTALAGGALPGSESWPLYLVRPADGASLDLPEPTAGGRVVLAVDQLEELFTSIEAQADRVAFLGQVVRAATDPMRRYVVAVSLRADFYGRCAPYPDFATLLSSNHVLLGPMRRDELVRAIEQPAAQAGLRVERELVDGLVDDVEGQPGSLPLLSTALLELWRKRDGRRLTAASYRLAGGLDGAVGRLAENAYSRLSSDEQATARSILLRLAAEEDGAIVRRRVPLQEFDLDGDAGRVVAVLTDARLLTASEGTLEVSHEALLREWPRLRAWVDEDRNGRRLLAHLAASSRDWDGRGRDSADLYRGPRLASALDWSSDHRGELNALEREFLDESRLANERELSRHRRENRRLRFLLAGVAILLLAAVLAGALALVARTHAQHEATVALGRELGARAVSTPRLDQAMLLAREAINLDRSPDTGGTLLATLLRAPAAVATFTTPLLSRPQRISISPDGRTLGVADNQQTVRLYDVATGKVKVLENLGFTTPPTWTPDGSKLVALSWGRAGPEIHVVDAHTYRLLRVLEFDKRLAAGIIGGTTGGYVQLLVTPENDVLYVYDVLNPDGSDGAAYVERWSLRTGRLISTTPVGAPGANDGSLIDGGRELAIGGTTAETILDARTLRRLRSVPLHSSSPIGCAAASPDGRRIVYGNTAGSVSFVDVRTGRVTPGSGSHTAFVAGCRFAPNGRFAVSVSDDGSAIVWNPATGRPLERLLGHAQDVHGLTISTDSRTVYTSSLDRAVFEWDLGGARRFGVPFSSTGIVNGPNQSEWLLPPLAVAPGGSEFAVRDKRQTIRLVSTQTGAKLAAFRVSDPLVTSLAFAPRSGRLAVSGENGFLQLWDTEGTPRVERTLAGMHSTNGMPETITAADFSPNGRLLAAGDVNQTPGGTPYRFGTVAVWDVASGRVVWRVRHKGGEIYAVAFAPSGRLVAAAQDDGTVHLYDAEAGRPLRTLHPLGAAETLAFAPDGTLATGSWAGTLQRWNPASGAEIGRPTLVHSAPVASIAFDPAGGSLATTGGSDGPAKLWALPSLQQYGADLPGHPGYWGTAAYTPDGSKLVVVYGDGGGYIWPVSVAAWARHACAVAGRNLTREEWKRFVGVRPYGATCPR